MYFTSQSYAQQRNASDLVGNASGSGSGSGSGPPDKVFVTIPDCSSPEHEGACPLSAFRALCLGALRRECVSTVDVAALWPDAPPAPAPAGLPVAGVVGVGVGALAVGTALAVAGYRTKRRTPSSAMHAPLVPATADAPDALLRGHGSDDGHARPAVSL